MDIQLLFQFKEAVTTVEHVSFFLENNPQIRITHGNEVEMFSNKKVEAQKKIFSNLITFH